jgi:hypothetical protein
MNIRVLIITISFSIPSFSNAMDLPQFKATFEVDAFGFTVGQARQTFSCTQDNEMSQTCQLTSIAKASGWFERFINESAVETITIQQQQTEFNWVQYQKKLSRRYDNRTEKKTITLKKDKKNQRILFIEKRKQWPIKEYIFDEISIVYAIQHAIINNQPLNNFYLQGDKIQQKLSLNIESKNKKINLPFRNKLRTTLITFKNSSLDAKVWLLNKHQFFPGKIKITNKKTNKTITLELDKLQKY